MSLIEKKREWRLSRARLIIIICLGWLSAFSFGLIREFINNRHQINQQIANLEKEVRNLTQENSELDKLITSWESSDQLEKEARLKLGLQKPGEKAILILRGDGKRLEEPMPSGEQIAIGNLVVINDKNLPNYLKWWFYFFGKK